MILKMNFNSEVKQKLEPLLNTSNFYACLTNEDHDNFGHSLEKSIEKSLPTVTGINNNGKSAQNDCIPITSELDTSRLLIVIY